MKIWKKKIQKQNIKIKYSETEEKLLKYLQLNKYITLREFRYIAQISKHRAESILANFVLLHILAMQVNDKETRFFISDKNKMEDELFRF